MLLVVVVHHGFPDFEKSGHVWHFCLEGRRDRTTGYLAASTTTPFRLTTAAGAPSSTSSKMTYQLPPMLLNLFAPRPPLRWVEPIDHAPEKRCTPKIGGVAQYLEAMREYKDNDGYVPTDSWLQKRDRKKIEKKEKQEKLLTDGVNDCRLSTGFSSFEIVLTI